MPRPPLNRIFTKRKKLLMLLKTKEIFATLNSLGAKSSIFLVKTFCITTFCNTIYALLSVKIISSIATMDFLRDGYKKEIIFASV